MTTPARIAILLAVARFPTFAQAQGTDHDVRRANDLEQMPQSLEVRFALSALPPYLRDDATSYVLDPANGYVLHHRGANGFSCLVLRTEWANPDAPFLPDLLAPMCYDAEGSKRMLRVWIDVAALRAQGRSPRQIYDAVTKRFTERTYQAPARPGIAYMLSPIMRTYMTELPSASVQTMSLPHYMFYAPNLTNADIGGKPFSQYPMILWPGPHGVVIVRVGETERTAILDESKELLAALCSYRDYLCLPKGPNGHQ